MSKKEIFNAILELKNYKPYIDKDEWQVRELRTGETLPFRFVHGGFTDTNIKFSFCFPKKEVYKERFFQFVCPFPGPDEEMASFDLKNENDKIAFAISHGAYFIETNMGSKQAFAGPSDPTIQYKSSSLAAEFSRIVASEMYGEHRPCGIIHGGSGGGFKTMACIENTNAFDGAVPYIIGSPMAIPGCHTSRAHAMRILRNVMPQIRDALEPGGNCDIYAGLNDLEKEALKEVTLMGMPPKSWLWKTMDSGALPVLAPGVKGVDPEYFVDFWEKDGYLGTVKNGSAQKDRIKFRATVKNIFVEDNSDKNVKVNATNGADDAFKKMMQTGGACYIELDDVPTGEDLYFTGTKIIFKTGEVAGTELGFGKIVGKSVLIGDTFGINNITEILEKVKIGDELELDNSDYIAIQTYHRHICPPSEYKAWDQYKDENATPIYPQRHNHLSLGFAKSASGAVQDGDIQGKVIVVASIHDESAYPWQPDWYRSTVAKTIEGKEEDKFRLWYVENSLHDDREETLDELHFTSYTGTLRQALLDVADWIQKGVEPRKTTNYEVNMGTVTLADKTKDRNGLQQTVELMANGGKLAKVKVNEEVEFEARIEFPLESGEVTFVEWSFEDDENFSTKGNFEKKDDYTVANYKYKFEKPGTYFPVVRVLAERNGNKKDMFTQMKNLGRVRIVVE